MTRSNANRRFFGPALCLIICTALGGRAVYGADATIGAFARDVKASLSAADQSWLVNQAQTALASTKISSAALKQAVDTHFAARKFDDQTSEALVLATLVEIEFQATDYSKALQDAVDAINRLKAQLRALKDAMDSLNDVSQELALQLQAMMQKLAAATALKSNFSAKDVSAKAAVIANIRG
jgi:hypothetical protein